jgi:hypothetical protein
MSSGYYTRAAAVASRLLAARAAGAAAEKALWEKAQNAAARLKTADEAHDRGEIRTAVHLYVRLAMSRPPNESSLAAKDRLGTLADEAHAKQAAIDATLAHGEPSPGEWFVNQDDPQVVEHLATWKTTVESAFEKYQRLVSDYEVVPSLGGKLKTHVDHQRRKPAIAMVLNEPEAKTLLETGLAHEAAGHHCCAYWVYRQAVQLAPAPSATKAKARLEIVEKVPHIEALAAACREMQRCHQIYARAERALPVNPDRARELFAEVTRRAPADSEVCRAAQRHLDQPATQ